MERILVATDFGNASKQALRHALVLAETYSVPLELVHVVPDPVEELRTDETVGLDLGDIAESWLRRAQAMLRTTACECLPLRVTTAVRLGSVTHHLLEHVADAHADLVVIGIANAARATLPSIGAIAEPLLRKSRCPVLAVPAGRDQGVARPLKAPWPRNILVPTDFSVHAHAAMAYAWDLAEKTDAALHVLHVNDLLWNEGPLASTTPENTIDGMRHLLEEEIAELQRGGNRRRLVYPLFASGEPAREILACADRIAADVVIMGTHGRGQVGRFLLGSVTHEVLEHTVRPVLVTHRAI